MIRYHARSTASADVAWSLIAEPARWHEWAPHIRGAWNLGTPEVREGAIGAARLIGIVPVPAKVTDKQAGRSWTWQVGPVALVHSVTPKRGGCEVAVLVSAPRPLEALLARTYGPLVQALVKRLARKAEAEGRS